MAHVKKKKKFKSQNEYFKNVMIFEYQKLSCLRWKKKEKEKVGNNESNKIWQKKYLIVKKISNKQIPSHVNDRYIDRWMEYTVKKGLFWNIYIMIYSVHCLQVFDIQSQKN